MFEKINSQIEEIKNDKNIGPGDKAGILKVAEYLLTREDMDEKYNNEEKTLTGMWDFIKEEARKKAENGVAVMEDADVYSIAIHYFDESNEALGIGKATKTTKNHTSVDKTTKQPKKEKTDKKATEQDAKVEENASNTKQDADVQHNDDDIAMIFKGKPITYKELREGNLFTR